MPVRIPPHDLDAERAVLGIVLIEGAATLAAIAPKLEPNDFYLAGHAVLYGRMLEMAAAGQAIDLITLSEALRTAGELEMVGGPAALALTIEHAAIAAHLPSYVAIVRDKAVLRDLIQSGTQLASKAFDERDDIAGLVEIARESVERIAARALVADKPFNAMTVAALLALEIPSPQFVVQEWIPEAALSFVVGDSEAYKSWFTTFIGFCVASGRTLFDLWPVKRMPVLIISEENGLPEDRRRMGLIAAGLGIDVAQLPLYVASETSFSFDDPARYAALRVFVDEHGIRLVIIDSFVRVHRREEKDAGEMNALYMDRIKPLLRAGVGILALHHKRKLPAGVHAAAASDSDDIRGSGDIRAAAHAILFLRTVADGKVVVKHNKSRGWEKQEPYVFALRGGTKDGRVEFIYEGAPEKALDKTEACRFAILEFAAKSKTFLRAELERHFAEEKKAGRPSFTRRVFDPILKALAKDGYPLKEDKVAGKRGCFYTYVSDDGVETNNGDDGEDVPF